MRHNQTLDYDGLLREAQKAVKDSGETQTAVADRLGVTGPAVNHALKKKGGTYARLQRRIIEELTGFRVEEVPVAFRVVKKGAA